MNREYLKNFVRTLENGQGKAFVEDLYQFLKEQHYLEEAQLPPDPTRERQLRPEHDIRSRLPRYRRQW